MRRREAGWHRQRPPTHAGMGVQSHRVPAGPATVAQQTPPACHGRGACREAASARQEDGLGQRPLIHSACSLHNGRLQAHPTLPWCSTGRNNHSELPAVPTEKLGLLGSPWLRASVCLLLALHRYSYFLTPRPRGRTCGFSR